MKDITLHARPSGISHQKDALLEIFDSPEYQARLREARRKDDLRQQWIRFICRGCLVLIGFLLGALLV